MLLSTKLHRAIVPDVAEEDLLESAAQDWEQDSGGKDAME
jgi:hypothetical protein